MNALSLLTAMPLSVAERTDYIAKVKDEVLSGAYNPIQVDIVLKAAEDTIAAIRKDRDIEMALWEQLDLYHEQTFEAFGATVTKSERKTYKYESSEDSEYLRIVAEIDKLTALKKAREEFLKAMPEGGMVNPDTGEYIGRPHAVVTKIRTIKIK